MEWGITAYAVLAGILEYLPGFHFFCKILGNAGKISALL
jgi:hypothetical protein